MKAVYVTPFVAGLLVMLLITIIIVDNSKPSQQFRELKELKAKCEETLPRNEHCVIIAIPQSKD